MFDGNYCRNSDDYYVILTIFDDVFLKLLYKKKVSPGRRRFGISALPPQTQHSASRLLFHNLFLINYFYIFQFFPTHFCLNLN